ncbi:PREDICTED: MAM and LDL-receptor class A domain-containing protein 2-like [Eufriesea mexicana]|uniref:MAM and LDL-receptor class A domain-containing protein 2-like n=1 Tax=Eufriesea mexicana TaxID=516756 RepID=UPI00083C4A02|nr:PREDICTED: MAM and LDL-receptor class A domain-containing protein 2-like [Eufriesea mexicana]
MKISSTTPFLLLLFFAQHAVCYMKSVSRCPVVRPMNGKVRVRAGGRIIRFTCQDGFTLVGNKYSTCIRGQWDTPTPVCVNTECHEPPMPEHAVMAPKYNGAILLYFCEPGYTLVGPSEIFCDGRQWNGTTPHCRDTTAAAPTQCNFEKPDLCWWEQDPRHDFDWRRQNFETPSFHIGTGPTHDHTLGPGNDGYYMYIEASGRLVNDTARLISPMYNASYTDGGCFSFWYHMFGATVGALNVYFKKDNDLVPRLMFNEEGDQGNQWLHGIFNLPKSNRSFQIIIEGVRGSSYVSDIAIDDVAILQGSKCRSVNKTENEGVTEGDEDQIEEVNAQQSCRGRCKNSVTYNFTSSMPPTQTDICFCTLDCSEHSICCPDYAEYCVLGYTEGMTVTTEQGTTANHEGPATVAPTRKDAVTEMGTVRTGFSMNPKDDIDPVTSRPWTTTTVKPTPNTTRKKVEKPTKSTKRITTTVATTRTTQTKETPFVRPTSLTTRYAPVDEKPDLDARRQDPEQVHRAATNFSMLGIIGVVVGVVVWLSISLMIVIIILRRRKTYKRGTNGSALSEDSDVRFLTSDEILDFTLARPSETDET